ncbi:hypothetical protein BTR22_07170 [Alkalihalophilus pseudofirmus]|uniref:hypothetical protein n=1 Tax=Alkalihalophilus pseudofirmus TaxID=79885 RepID=UPI000952F07F|nr:hypothetical protein BTR22_07170 [Alkalihalophilus pseudofirmus]
MRKYFLLFFIVIGLVTTSACGSEEGVTETIEEDQAETVSEDESVDEDVPSDEETSIDSEDVESNEIDTSVFEYASQVDVTDAIDINEHVTLFVHMSEDTKPGLATQHVVNQTYDFLQQEEVQDAKTVSVNVKQGEVKIAMFTVNTDQFVPQDDIPMSDVVLEASDIEFMTEEVKQYGENLGTW